MPLKLSDETRVPKKEKISGLRPEKDRTTPEFFCSHTPIVMVNFNGNVLGQKKGQNVKRPDFQRLGFWVVPMSDHPRKRAYVAHFRGWGGDGAKE